MRAVWFVAVLLAGCTAPPEEDEPESHWGVCPQWIAGESSDATWDLNGTTQFTLDANASLAGYALDLYNLRFTGADGVELRFWDQDGRRLGAVVYGQETNTRPVVTAQGDVELDVFLTAVTQGTAPAPGPLTVEAIGQGPVSFTWTPWYRVCGTPS